MIRANLCLTAGSYWCAVCGEFRTANAACATPDLVICGECIKAGDFDAKLTERAFELRARADVLLAHLGQIRTPSFDEWQQAARLMALLWRDGQVTADKMQQVLEWPAEQRDELLRELLPEGSAWRPEHA